MVELLIYPYGVGVYETFLEEAMRRLASLLLGSVLLAGPVTVGPLHSQDAKLRCTLTDKKIEKCCCEQRGDKLYCPLAKKTIEKCCCEPVKK